MQLEKMRSYLSKENLDAVLVTSSYNRRYMTGFTGSAGVVFITMDKAVFLTDFRYTEQAKVQCPNYEIRLQAKTMFEEVAGLIEEFGAKRVGFEKDHMTVTTFAHYKGTASCEWVGISGVIEEFRLKKSENEIKIIKDATRIADAAFTYILDVIKPGMTELEVSNELEFYMRKLGATSSSFDIIVASGTRSSLPHGVATNKILEVGDMITMDFGAYYEGYVSDITRTVALGTPSDKLREIYNVVCEAQRLGVEGLAPGITGKEADALTRDYITEKGYGQYFGHSTGHGIGLEVHEGPGLSVKSDTVLEPGMIVTVEPGIYIPELGGVRIEDDVLITADGHEVLTKSPKELIIL